MRAGGMPCSRRPPISFISRTAARVSRELSLRGWQPEPPDPLIRESSHITGVLYQQILPLPQQPLGIPHDASWLALSICRTCKSGAAS